MGDGKTASAENRTHLAGDRTMLAAERTLSAWWRTSMTALAGAVGFVRLFGNVQPQWPIRTGATLLIGLALLMLAIALRRYRHTAQKIENEEVGSLSMSALITGTGLLVLVAGIAGVVTWMF
jgi:putative membrane protein